MGAISAKVIVLAQLASNEGPLFMIAWKSVEIDCRYNVWVDSLLESKPTLLVTLNGSVALHPCYIKEKGLKKKKKNLFWGGVFTELHCAHTHTNTHTHARTHAHKQTHRHTYIYLYVYKGEMVDFGESDKMIKISGKVGKRDTTGLVIFRSLFTV